MRHELETIVTVVPSNDETLDDRFIGKKGLVIGYNDNGMTGNTTDDPLHIVAFGHDEVEEFWFEELEVVND